MKKIFLLALSASIACTLNAQVQMPQVSPTQTIVQNFGLGKIMLSYSRPSIKGRTLFMQNSDLAPVGKLWRTGANDATRFTFTDFVNINGKDLDSGQYVFYTIPGEKEWTIIFNKGLSNEGASGYKESEDVLRFTVPSKKMSGNPIETFTINFWNIKPESCEIHLLWGNTDVSIPVTTNIKDRLRTQLEAALQGNDKPYWQAANFYYESDKNYPKALENVNNALKDNQDAYYMFMLKAKIQKAMGDKTGAKESAQKCIDLATAQKNDDYVKQGNTLIKSL
jgi:hypothetical protein